MLHQTHHRRVITTAGAGLLALLLLSTCNKIDTKDDIVYTVTATMPHDGTPVPGVKVNIVEYKEKKGKLEETGWVRQDVTDATGRAWGRFMGIRKGNYSYYIYFDYSGMQLPAGIDDVAVKGPQYDYLNRGVPIDNDYKIRILPYTSMYLKIENIHCLDASDIMHYKVFNYDENPHGYFNPATPWSNDFIGCGIQFENTFNHVLAGHRVYQIEVIRNGIDTIYYDTFNLLPNTVNEVFLEY